MERIKKFLIFGANSSIAKCFIEQLRNDNYEIIEVHRKDKSLNIYTAEAIKKIIKNASPDVIINFVGCFSSDFEQSYNVNVGITKIILDVCVESKYAGKIILTGSAAEYGLQTIYNEKCVEEPRSIYGLTKLMQHSLVKFYNINSGLDINYIRLFNVVAPNLNKQLFIGNLYNQLKLLLSGKASKLELGNLNVYRDYLYIDDVYLGVMSIINNDIAGEVFNVGMGEAILLDEFVKKILLELNLNIKIDTVEKKSIGNIDNVVVANIDKMKSIGWKPINNYDELIINFCQQLLNKN